MKGFRWSGEVPALKWMNFYTKILSRYATGAALKLVVNIEAMPAEGVSNAKIEETKFALRELGLRDEITLVLPDEPKTRAE
jgi:hypothetical protein